MIQDQKVSLTINHITTFIYNFISVYFIRLQLQEKYLLHVVKRCSNSNSQCVSNKHVHFEQVDHTQA